VTVYVVTGGRDHHPDDGTLDAALTWATLVHVGDATGLDECVRRWCERRRVPFTVHRADWIAHGKAAGPIRNRAMLTAAAADGATLVAFPGGRGTADCVRQARAMGVPVVVFGGAA
jgi:hypothetical protein